MTGPDADPQVAWHRAECWGYRADLALWSELAGEPPSRVLDIGCGAGRVAIELARSGHQVTGLDYDARLLDYLGRHEPRIETVVADAADFDLGRRFDLILAPMQTLQLLTDPVQRQACLRNVRDHMHAGSHFAAAFVELDLGAVAIGRNLLDGQEAAVDFDPVAGDGLASSRSTGLFLESDHRLRIQRQRRLYAASSEAAVATEKIEFELALLSRDEIEAEFRVAGLGKPRWRSIAPTDSHMGAEVAIAAVACQSP